MLASLFPGPISKRYRRHCRAGPGTSEGQISARIGYAVPAPTEGVAELGSENKEDSGGEVGVFRIGVGLVSLVG